MSNRAAPGDPHPLDPTISELFLRSRDESSIRDIVLTTTLRLLLIALPIYMVFKDQVSLFEVAITFLIGAISTLIWWSSGQQLYRERRVVEEVLIYTASESDQDNYIRQRGIRSHILTLPQATILRLEPIFWLFLLAIVSTLRILEFINILDLGTLSVE